MVAFFSPAQDYEFVIWVFGSGGFGFSEFVLWSAQRRPLRSSKQFLSNPCVASTHSFNTDLKDTP
jgi:hypothetical protein